MPHQDGDEALRAFQAWEEQMHQGKRTSLKQAGPKTVTLTVEIIEARDLLAKDIGGTSDPYTVVRTQSSPASQLYRRPNQPKFLNCFTAQLSIGYDQYRTEVKKKTLDPKWNASFEFKIDADSWHELKLVLWDKDVVGKDDFLGQAFVDVGKLLDEATETDPEWISLLPKKYGSRVRGDVKIKLAVSSPLPVLPPARYLQLGRKENQLDFEMTDYEAYAALTPADRSVVKQIENFVAAGNFLLNQLVDSIGIMDSQWRARLTERPQQETQNDQVTASRSRTPKFLQRFVSDLKQPIFNPSDRAHHRQKSSDSLGASSSSSSSSFTWDVVLDDKSAPSLSHDPVTTTTTALVVTGLNDLPDELLFKIFQYVPATQRPGARRVCQLWNSILNDPALKSLAAQANEYMHAASNAKADEVNQFIYLAMPLLRRIFNHLRNIWDWSNDVETFVSAIVMDGTCKMRQLQIYRSLISLKRLADTASSFRAAVPDRVRFNEMVQFWQQHLMLYHDAPQDRIPQEDRLTADEYEYWKAGSPASKLRLMRDTNYAWLAGFDTGIRSNNSPLADDFALFGGEALQMLQSRKMLSAFEISRALDFIMGGLPIAELKGSWSLRWDKVEQFTKIMEPYIKYINPDHVSHAFKSPMCSKSVVFWHFYKKCVIYHDTHKRTT